MRQLCVHHPCGFTSCKVGLWFLPAWRRYHLVYSTNCCTPRYVHPIRARTTHRNFLAHLDLPGRNPHVPSSPSRRSPSICTRQIQHGALGNPALLQSFVFRHLRTHSVFVYHLTLALSLSCALFAKNTGGVSYAGRRSQATGRTPLTPLFPIDRKKRAVMGEYRPSYVSRGANIFYREPTSLGAGQRALAFHESQLSNHRSRSLSARRHAWCHKPAEVGV